MCTAYIYKIKKENLPKLSVYRIWRKSLRTQEHVQLIQGKRAIEVRAIEVLLYVAELWLQLKRTTNCAMEPAAGWVMLCLFVWFGLNLAFNNLSVISRRCLDVAGSSMLTFRVLPHWNIMPQTLWHNIPPSHIILTLSWPVPIPSSTFLMLSAKRKSS